MTRRAWLVVIALALGLQAIVLWRYCGGRTATHSPTLRRGALAGDAAPALALESDGVPTPWTPAAGRPQLVHFWATWCPPCVAELPTLLAEARAAGAPLLAASLDDGWPAIAAFFAPGPVPAEVARVVDRAGPARFGAAALPDSYLVDADGRLRERLPGAQSWASQPGARRCGPWRSGATDERWPILLATTLEQTWSFHARAGAHRAANA